MNSLTQFLGAYNSDDEENDLAEKTETTNIDSSSLVNEANNQQEVIAATSLITDWAKCTDHAIGHPYYWNMATKEVTWVMPPEYQNFLDTSKIQLSELPVDEYWKKGEDQNTSFYVNELTRIVTWRKPPGYKEHIEEKPVVDQTETKETANNKEVAEQTEADSRKLFPWKHAPKDELQSNDAVVEDTESLMASKFDEVDLAASKTFKRKRRIEFIKPTPSKPKVASYNFVPPVDEDRNELENSGNVTSPSPDGEENNDDCQRPPLGEAKEKIKSLIDLLKSKLTFLVGGRPEVSSVQIILCQMQCLLEAYDKQALDADYLYKWLVGVSSNLKELETSAAPNGWTCSWDRACAKYRYENTQSGEVSWEFPDLDASISTPADVADEVIDVTEQTVDDIEIVEDVKLDNDEMDICTTPPPPSIPSINCNDELQPPEPPKWDLPLPPGIESEPKNLSLELASFYSDIASLESTTSPTANESETTPGSAAVAITVDNDLENANDEPVKPKKKKTLKLQYKQVDEVSNMMAKWRKAQEELVG